MQHAECVHVVLLHCRCHAQYRLILYRIFSSIFAKMDPLSVKQSNFNKSAALSLLVIPRDVLENCIFKDFCISSIVACSLTCLQLRKISLRLAQKENWHRTQKDILYNHFFHGFLNLWKWFQAELRYPTINALLWTNSRLHHICLVSAAKGILNSCDIVSVYCFAEHR